MRTPEEIVDQWRRENTEIRSYDDLVRLAVQETVEEIITINANSFAAREFPDPQAIRDHFKKAGY